MRVTSQQQANQQKLYSSSKRRTGIHLYVQVRIGGHVQPMLVPLMLQQLPVHDRTYLLRRYARCFCGADAVTFFLSRRFARTEAEALAVGNALLKAGVFRHVKNEHLFRNGAGYFYRFAAHEDYVADGDGDAVTLRSSRMMSVACASFVSIPEIQRIDTAPVLADYRRDHRGHRYHQHPLNSSAVTTETNATAISATTTTNSASTNTTNTNSVGTYAKNNVKVPNGAAKARYKNGIFPGAESGDTAMFSFEESFICHDDPENRPEFDEADVIVETGIRIGSRVFPDLVGKFIEANGLTGDQVVGGKTYKSSFTGRVACKWLVRKEYAANVEEAIGIGNAMLASGVFYPLDAANGNNNTNYNNSNNAGLDSISMTSTAPTKNGFECSSKKCYRLIADTDISQELKRGARKDMFLKLLGINRAKPHTTKPGLHNRHHRHPHQSPWFEEQMSFSFTSQNSGPAELQR